MAKIKFNILVDPKWLEDVRFLELSDTCKPVSLGDGKDCIGVADKLLPEQVLEFALVNKIPHVVQSSNLGFEQELNTSALMMSDRKLFFDYPISSVFAPTQAGAEKEKEYLRFERPFTRSDEKIQVLSDFDEFIQTLPGTRTVHEDALLIMDELFTNAVFNAPFIDEENASVGANRSGGAVSMGEGKQGRVFAGCDQERLLIGCSDPFGRLNIPALIRRMENCYSKGVDKSIRSDAGGAGIGSYMVYQCCASYYVAVEKNQRTTVCGLLPLGMGYRQRGMISKNIHFLES